MKFLTPVIGSLLFAGFLVGCSEEKDFLFFILTFFNQA